MAAFTMTSTSLPQTCFAASQRTATPSAFLAGRPLASRPARNVVAQAADLPNWNLDKPNRLWELDTTWYPGAEAPSYLDGSLPGDRGFDPLRLAANDDTRPWLVEAELYHGRIAMMAVLGVLFVEAIGKGPFWDAPFRAASPLAYWPTVIVAHAIWATFELKRYQNFQSKGETGLLNSVPFDPLGQLSDHNRQAEVRNGRLAMLANLGFWSQAAIYGKGPLESLSYHLEDPGHHNILTSKVGTEVLMAVVAITVTPIVLEARKTLTPKREETFRPIPFL